MEEVEIKFKKFWKPPRRCRWFGHRFRETEYQIGVLAFLCSPLFVCERCGCGRFHGLPGMNYVTPDKVKEFVRRQNMKAVQNPQQDKVVPLGESHTRTDSPTIEEKGKENG